jgi:hypothetical protein
MEVRSGSGNIVDISRMDIFPMTLPIGIFRIDSSSFWSGSAAELRFHLNFPRGLMGIGIFRIAVGGAILLGFTASLLVSCIPSASAQTQPFLGVELEFLDQYELPSQIIEGTQLGGLSAIAYDARRDLLYVLSDDHGGMTSPHFYTLSLDLATDSLVTDSLATGSTQPRIKDIEVESVTFFTDAQGTPYPANALDPEGLALSPQDTLYVASEGLNPQEIQPLLSEFDLKGQFQHQLPVPQRFQVAIDPQSRRQQRGVQSNMGLESLTLAPAGIGVNGQLLRLFTANEAPLVQDLDPELEAEGGRNRFLHYYLGAGPPVLLAEYLYPLETVPFALINGLSEILALDNGGHFLALERALTPFGFQIKLFEISLAGASDISARSSLQGNLNNINKIQKRLVLNFNDLEVPLRNLEGISFGPQLPDGSQSLILVSDNNFNGQESTQFLWFRLLASSPTDRRGNSLAGKQTGLFNLEMS